MATWFIRDGMDRAGFYYWTGHHLQRPLEGTHVSACWKLNDGERVAFPFGTVFALSGTNDILFIRCSTFCAHSFASSRIFACHHHRHVICVQRPHVLRFYSMRFLLLRQVVYEAYEQEW
eukprot:TRINITY_DN1815_c0_g1_i7.p2 TRINITY_DN1815_c0_g1~~TRINITY_DN1815_c0_g1_i7.p2  ORF type:complete len:119 (-),score=0.21 TRINITY_DN1815_c0_g1_i7:245-601(-)